MEDNFEHSPSTFSTTFREGVSVLLSPQRRSEFLQIIFQFYEANVEVYHKRSPELDGKIEDIFRD